MKGRFYCNLLGINVEDYNPNPKAPIKHPNQIVNDCLIRACCKLLNKDWDVVFREVAKIAFEEGVMYNSVQIVLKRYMEENGYKVIRLFNDVSVGQIIYENKDNTILVGNCDHIVCVENGTIYDTERCNKVLDRFLISKAYYVVKENKKIKEN